MASESTKPLSFKKETLRLLDQFLLGHISAGQLKTAAIPMLQLSSQKRGRKNYIERYLIDISTRQDQDLTREYIYEVREVLLGETAVSEKNRTHVFKRTLRKLIERFYYDEIEEDYFLSLLYDLMFEFNEELGREKEIRDFFNKLQAITPIISEESNEEKPSEIWNLTMSFYDMYFRSLWDE